MQIKTANLLDFEKTIAKDFLIKFDTPWHSLAEIKEYILELGKTLPEEKFNRTKDDIWIAKSASVSPSAHISGPCIIDENAEIRHCAFIRGSVIVGKDSIIGNSTELKNCILFDGVQVPHFNYVGDSILGYKSHLGAGAVTSNVKSDRSLITVNVNGEKTETKLKKFGAIIGDNCEIGCNAVLCPGTVLEKNVTIYPTTMARGYIKTDTILKNDGSLTAKNKAVN